MHSQTSDARRKQPYLYWFAPPEFNRSGRNWFPVMCPRLLILLDVLRSMHGHAITTSPVQGAIGRHKGRNDRSQHNFDYWDEVRAVDVFVDKVFNEAQARDLVDLAIAVGFTGIGVYPDWNNKRGERQVGLHFDTRRKKRPGEPVTWGQVNGDWVSIDEALSEV